MYHSIYPSLTSTYLKRSTSANNKAIGQHLFKYEAAFSLLSSRKSSHKALQRLRKTAHCFTFLKNFYSSSVQAERSRTLSVHNCCLLGSVTLQSALIFPKLPFKMHCVPWDLQSKQWCVRSNNAQWGSSIFEGGR